MSLYKENPSSPRQKAKQGTKVSPWCHPYLKAQTLSLFSFNFKLAGVFPSFSPKRTFSRIFLSPLSDGIPNVLIPRHRFYFVDTVNAILPHYNYNAERKNYQLKTKISYAKQNRQQRDCGKCGKIYKNQNIFGSLTISRQSRSPRSKP